MQLNPKRLFFAVCLLCLFLSPKVDAATVTGKITITGSVPENPPINMDADPVCKAMHGEPIRAEKVVVNSDQTLRHVFVYVKEGLTSPGETPKSPAVLDQKGCMYAPHVLGMQAGQPLAITNSDSTLHNVHALAKNNPEFNLGMPIQGMKLEKTFFNPEVMLKFKCDVHPWMNAYIGILPHQAFAVTGEDGTFEITGLPAGEYTLEAWHETFGTQTQKVQLVGSDASKQVDFGFSSKQIQDEATGVSVKVDEPKPIEQYDDSAALDLPRRPPGWWLPENISSFGPKIDFLFYVILVITGTIFFGVQGTLFCFLFRYRGKEGKAHYTHGNAKIEVIWTVIPAVILVILAFMGQGVWDEVKAQMPTDPATVLVRIQAEQFAWNIQYPGADGQFDTADDIRNINQLHIPVNRPVRVTLSSVEKQDKPAVLHSFFLPELRLKQDVVPGMAIDVWFEAKRTGRYEIACAEFCGLGHYRMRGFLSIHSQEGYEKWLEEQVVGI